MPHKDDKYQHSVLYYSITDLCFINNIKYFFISQSCVMISYSTITMLSYANTVLYFAITTLLCSHHALLFLYTAL